MAYTTIDKPTDYFNTKLYTGTRANQSITGVGHQPDLVWIKDRTNTNNHVWTDSVRGVEKVILSNATNAETTYTDGLVAFTSDGFNLGDDDAGQMNVSGNACVSWNWKASGSTASNTDGSITSTVSANTTAGFSIATFTCPSSGTAFDVGHGLGGKPDMMIMKTLTGGGGSWWTWHIGLGDNTTDYLSLNSTNAELTISGMWGTVGAGTSTFGYTAGTSAASDQNIVAYFFKSIKSYSKFGTYIGNGNADGTFVYTGFKPAFVITRRTDTTENWAIFDNKRDGFNVNNRILLANVTDAENTSATYLDLLSNGFKTRATSGAVNASGGTYIYMAFAEYPFVTSSGIPTTAR